MSKEHTKGQFETADDQIVSDEKSKTQNNESTHAQDEQVDKDDAVKYSTHKKLLNQLKNKSEELEELRQYRREKEEEAAKKKGDYEALIKSRDERLQELQEKLQTYERDITEGTKLQAFIDRLPGKVKRNEYLSFVDLEKIALDPESKTVDEHTLKKAVDDFVTNHGDLLDTKQTNTLPKVGSLGGRPNKKRSLKELSREELKEAYLAGNFED